MPPRDYQINIVQKCLLQNSLVVLPTGCGKTFIAAVLMLNYYRWYSNAIVSDADSRSRYGPATTRRNTGKLIFLAPTKPLVAQQIDACVLSAGIPKDDVVEMNGTISPEKRSSLWQTRSVFFLTPQVLDNDLRTGLVAPESIVCVVIDEAHRATGNYAYVTTVRAISERNPSHFRVLALSATPGNDLRAVQEVVSNLRISHLEVREESSIDVAPYIHRRQLQVETVPLTPAIHACAKVLQQQLMRPIVERLVRMGVLAAHLRDYATITKGSIVVARNQFFAMSTAGSNGNRGAILGDLGLLMSLAHAQDLLMNIGMRSCLVYLDGSQSSSSASASELSGVSKKSSSSSSSSATSSSHSRMMQYTAPLRAALKSHLQPDVASHPKMGRLESLLVAHFSSSANTRAMVFVSYRECASEICDRLSRHPGIRAALFVGQARIQKTGAKGLRQSEQVAVIESFRRGDSINVLVSTCIGEEGLDIGEVDLIVCYDAPNNPTRTVQRMGRTGRAREGRAVVLMSEGREEASYAQMKKRKETVSKSILTASATASSSAGSSKQGLVFVPSPRMIPDDIHPRRVDAKVIEQSPLKPLSATAAAPAASSRAIGGAIATVTSAVAGRPPVNHGGAMSAASVAASVATTMRKKVSDQVVPLQFDDSDRDADAVGVSLSGARGSGSRGPATGAEFPSPAFRILAGMPMCARGDSAAARRWREAQAVCQSSAACDGSLLSRSLARTMSLAEATELAPAETAACKRQISGAETTVQSSLLQPFLSLSPPRSKLLSETSRAAPLQGLFQTLLTPMTTPAAPPPPPPPKLFFQSAPAHGPASALRSLTAAWPQPRLRLLRQTQLSFRAASGTAASSAIVHGSMNNSVCHSLSPISVDADARLLPSSQPALPSRLFAGGATGVAASTAHGTAAAAAAAAAVVLAEDSNEKGHAEEEDKKRKKQRVVVEDEQDEEEEAVEEQSVSLMDGAGRGGGDASNVSGFCRRTRKYSVGRRRLLVHDTTSASSSAASHLHGSTVADAEDGEDEEDEQEQPLQYRHPSTDTSPSRPEERPLDSKRRKLLGTAGASAWEAGRRRPARPPSKFIDDACAVASQSSSSGGGGKIRCHSGSTEDDVEEDSDLQASTSLSGFIVSDDASLGHVAAMASSGLSSDGSGHMRAIYARSLMSPRRAAGGLLVHPSRRREMMEQELRGLQNADGDSRGSGSSSDDDNDDVGNDDDDDLASVEDDGSRGGNELLTATEATRRKTNSLLLHTED